jgi:nucleotide-binding universal stress UspA family protein
MLLDLDRPALVIFRAPLQRSRLFPVRERDSTGTKVLGGIAIAPVVKGGMIMIKRILLGYDGSENAERALTFAIDLAQRQSAELHVLAVLQPPDFAIEIGIEALMEGAQKHCELLIDAVEEKLRKESISAVSRIETGRAGEQIVRYAKEHQIDHVVVGHRGHSLFERWLIGSVSRQVIAHSHCSVTVVR